MTLKRLPLSGEIVALVLALAPMARATPLGLDFADTTGTTGLGCFQDCTVGWVFQVNASIIVDGLAVFDWNADGLGLSHTVGLWNSSGTPLVSTNVTDAGTLRPSTSSFGDWRVQSIAPVVLRPGTYTIGSFFYAFTLDPTDAYFGGGVASTIPQIHFLGSAIVGG